MAKMVVKCRCGRELINISFDIIDGDPLVIEPCEDCMNKYGIEQYDLGYGDMGSTIRGHINKEMSR